MRAENAEGLVVGVGRECGARRAGTLAPHLLALGLVDILGFRAQDRHLLVGKTVRQEQIASLVEFLELARREFHGAFLAFFAWFRGAGPATEMIIRRSGFRGTPPLSGRSGFGAQ